MNILKVKSLKIIKCDKVPVYDLECPKNSNFVLESGAVVHNSKDIADSVAGSIYQCFVKADKYMAAVKSEEYMDYIESQTSPKNAYHEIFATGDIVGENPLL